MLLKKTDILNLHNVSPVSGGAKEEEKEAEVVGFADGGKLVEQGASLCGQWVQKAFILNY